MKKWITWIAVAVVMLGAGYFIYEKNNTSIEIIESEPEPSITFETTQETLAEKLTVKGKAAYTEETDVFAPLSVNVQSWNVKHGQRVKKGEVLMSLDTKALMKEIKNLEAEIKKSRIEANLQQINLQQSVETEAVGNMTTGEERKKAFIDRESKKLTEKLNEEVLALREEELKDKRAMLATATVYAPTTGVFLFTDTNPKTRALTEGQLFGKIVNTEKLQFVTNVSEQDIFKIKEGMQVQVNMSGQKDKTSTGAITQVSLFPKQASATDGSQASQFEVVIELESSDWLIGGLTLEGQIETQRKENAIVVPTLAVMRDQEQPYVMINDSIGQPKRRIIKTGLEVDDKTEVLMGLRAGETVVLP
ncbi:efflux RND transporter periplasmic adaptor subunit [Paenibacillus pinisoli]|uniref:Efflux RND transporter periplasmic adaptor subunit n=1 Tax=Paenibacillus pinisoli TaxID=1276110 RepID=A0A3A6PZ84_9BACL|nr:efflux RND transporter periplasmic adaptor subunit [Paenibacillus pinisoli]RJX40623.1 efflux RND transporter periplasmic adaptor subunit [Paenibacillus pinisoli]